MVDICDAEISYPLTGQLYTRKSSADREKNVGKRVVKNLVDDYFTTLLLAKFLLSWKTRISIVETVEVRLKIFLSLNHGV